MDKEVLFECIFHWQCGSEIFFLHKFVKNLGKLLHASSSIFDPYAINCKIATEKIPLCGAWLDSGVNILSMLSQFTSFNSTQLVLKNISLDEYCNQPYFVELLFLADNIPIDIFINWEQNLDYKKSSLIYEKGIIDIFHSNQTVYFNGLKVFESPKLPRLSTHYYNYFIYKLPIIMNGNCCKEEILNIHKKLFEINIKL
jgi:hypothetical protein